MFRLTTYVPIYELTYILLSFLAFQIAKYLLYINDRIVNVCKYIYIYLTYLSAPMSIPLRCSTEPKSILKFQNQTHINHVSRKKGFDEPSSKEIITRFSVFFVLIVKQRRYFGKKDRLICLWKSP